MDYNNIQSRLERTFSSLNERFDENSNKHVNVQEWSNGKGVSITFDNTDKNLILNRIMNILHNLASLKDHLKACMEKKELDPKIVEEEINNSLHLQVLIDLINKEKHGGILKSHRSNKNPVIEDPTNSFRLGSKKGSPIEKHSSDIPTMFIDAQIRDDKGNFLFTLDDLVEICFMKWKNLAKTYNCD
jgi:hypothetical protein